MGKIKRTRRDKERELHLDRWFLQLLARMQYDAERRQESRNYAKGHNFEEWLQR